MKKIALLFAAVAFMAAANAQVVVGLQGGYHQQKTTNTLNGDFNVATEYLGGLRAGYMITPKLYVGVAGGILGNSTNLYLATGDTNWNGSSQTFHIKDHKLDTKQSGWTVSPQIRYEVLKYGNMHFHLLLQGTYSKTGYTNYVESWVWVGDDYYPNPNEYDERDPYDDSIRCASWSINLRPTLTYEFSKHLSAELSLDFLSIGYVNQTVSHDQTYLYNEVNGTSSTLEPYSRTTTTFYGGLNTLMETLRWESPMLRLGFNWTF